MPARAGAGDPPRHWDSLIAEALAESNHGTPPPPDWEMRTSATQGWSAMSAPVPRLDAASTRTDGRRLFDIRQVAELLGWSARLRRTWRRCSGRPARWLPKRGATWVSGSMIGVGEERRQKRTIDGAWIRTAAGTHERSRT